MEQQNSTGLVVTAEPPVLRGSSWNVLFLPLAFTAGLAVLTILPPVRENSRLLTAFLVAVAFLFTWNAFLLFWTRRTGRVLTVDLVVKKQHAVQACAQAAVLLYWGWYWREVYTSAYLIGAQLLFAYAFDLLLGWSRRDKCTLGFAQFPIVLSINLFLWFKPDWFYLQFLMVAVGLTAKELIRWNRDGRRVHIFNPSSFPLALFSLLLLAKGASDITWGHKIAITQFYPPHMYLFLFLIALPGQLFFGVTSMTMSAVVTTYLFGLLYQAATGVYFFYDSYIPIAVFLGMHLLFNDPSTSPRTELGRIIYGALYGLSTVLLYRLLGSLGMPTFYDKLLQVPLLNLSVQWIDRAGAVAVAARLRSRGLGQAAAALQRNLAYISIWVVDICGNERRARRGRQSSRPMAALLAHMPVKMAAHTPAPILPMWSLVSAIKDRVGRATKPDLLISPSRGRARICGRLDPAQAAATFQPRMPGSDFRWPAQNLNTLTRGVQPVRDAPPTLKDYPIILRGSKGRDSRAESRLPCTRSRAARAGRTRVRLAAGGE